MDLELWAELSAAIDDVSRATERNGRDTHPTSRVVRVHLWSVLSDRPTAWACDGRHWPDAQRPPALPHRSRMGRRMARPDFERFLTRLGARLDDGPARDALVALRVVDGKPLELPNHTTDPDASWGRGVSRTSVGYKLHAIWSGRAMPDAFAITGLGTCEKQMAARMLNRIDAGDGRGYLLGDSHYDASWLFDLCRGHGQQLVCPRAKPGKGLGHRYHAPDRLRAIGLLEAPPDLNRFGPQLYAMRGDIERSFSGLVAFGGGLTTLPPWVRRPWRVRRWVWGKLLVNAARLRLLDRGEQRIAA